MQSLVWGPARRSKKAYLDHMLGASVIFPIDICFLYVAKVGFFLVISGYSNFLYDICFPKESIQAVKEDIVDLRLRCRS